MQPVSVITTVLNERDSIPHLIATLLAQEPPAAEIIVVDGGSKDGTWEWLEEVQRKYATVRAIRDESCNLRNCAGPISRGRNVAIAAATSEWIACADAGCTYQPDWLARLTAPLQDGSAEYALGGSCLDMNDPTVWDLASAPFFSVRLSEDTPSKSCTARSMAFTKRVWEKVGGFPENVLLGEDTLFDLNARRAAATAFPVRAKAFYRPQLTLGAACHQMSRYAMSDGVLHVRFARLFRNAGRCALEVLALLSLCWSFVPILVVMAIELWYAYRADWQYMKKTGLRALLARLVYSVMVPWLVMSGHIRGRVTGKLPVNQQNRAL